MIIISARVDVIVHVRLCCDKRMAMTREQSRVCGWCALSLPAATMHGMIEDTVRQCL